MNWRVGITSNKGRIESKNFNTLDECYDYILSFSGDEVLTHYRIMDLITKEILEDEQGKRG